MQNKKTRALCLDVEWIGHAKCHTCAMRSSVLFSGLSELELDSLLQPVDQFIFHARTQIYARGDAGTHLVTIRSGVVKLEQNMPNGATRVVRLLQAGDVIGLEALVGENYHHNAVAMTDVDACRISTKVINDLDARSPRLHAQLLLRWQKSLDEADDFIVQLSTGSSTARLARLLLKLSAMGAHEPFIAPSREDIGSMLGITTETSSRLMAEFKRQGWVREAHGQCVSCDCTQLANVAMDID